MLKKTLLLTLVVLLVSSCATVRENRTYCIVAGTLAGAAVAGAAQDDSKRDAALGGAVVGGAVAWFFCKQDEDGDGVTDDKDSCPGTPKGIKVNAAGCPLDADGDGVPDYLDQCPNTKAGAKVDSRGCELDSDGDGVPDSADQCPNTPKGRTVDSKGCELDDDGDGVVNAVDECPNTPKGKPVDHKGCNVIFTLQGVNFEYNKSQLNDAAKARLTAELGTLKQHPNIKFSIDGHTDSKGPDDYNQRLSEKRAASVRTYLQEAGISPSRMTTRGFGESKPIATNDTKEGRAMNRRVELVVTES